MPTPLFWHRDPGVLARILTPLSWANGRRARRRLAKGKGARVDVPVIAIGVPDVGGGGRTQVAMSLAMRLSQRGVAVHIVVPGAMDATRVSPETHRALQVGDAALVLAAFAPTWVARDATEAARAAIDAGADAVIRLGGFLDPGLAHNLTVAVIDAARGFGNGHGVPSGPLRLPLSDVMARADLLICIGSDAAQVAFTARWGARLTRPRVSGTLRPLPTGLPLADLRVVAFAGTRRPDQFFAALHDAGANLHAAHALDAAQPLSDTLMTRILREAAQSGAHVVTTEMDAVRLPDALRPQVMTIPLRLEIADPTALDAALARLFSG